jgi:hypothetical protein
MEIKDCQRIHAALDAIGMRQSGTGVGLLALMRELLDAGVLDGAAIGRIKESIVADIGVTRPRTSTHAEFERMVRMRLDALVPITNDG